MTKKYPYSKPIPHWFVLRILIVSPFALLYFIAQFITERLEKFGKVLDKVIPDAYKEEWVEWDQLPQREQKEIERLAKHRDTIKERILFQTQRVDTH